MHKRWPVWASEMPTHILFDFFGTLVDYDSRRAVTEYPQTLTVLEELGASLTGEELLTRWADSWLPFELRSQQDHREFSMTEVGTAFLTDVLGRMPGADEVARLNAAYINEWNGGVYHIDGLTGWIKELSRSYRLAIVSNTHEADLVPNHLERLGIADLFDLVVLSVELGWRKPHPEIYTAAMDGLRLRPEQAVFVGDTHLADFIGPQQAGITAYLIDPDRTAGIPEEHRLDSIFDLSEKLSRPAG